VTDTNRPPPPLALPDQVVNSCQWTDEEAIAVADFVFRIWEAIWDCYGARLEARSRQVARDIAAEADAAANPTQGVNDRSEPAS